MDLSSFPLLRIDQLADHSDSTLAEAEGQLEAMAREHGDQHALSSFVTKLLHSIRHERARRREKAAAGNNKSQHRVSPKKGSSTTSFVTSNIPSVGKSSFKTRMRQQALSRSREAELNERLISEKKQARHEKLKAWREEREAAKSQREALLEMEREVRRTKRAEKEDRMLIEMRKAADDAREAVLVSGCSDLVKAAELAAKAAAKVIDDGSASVLDASDDDGSSVESFANEGSTAQVLSPEGGEDVLEIENEMERDTDSVDDLTSSEECGGGNVACRSASEDEEDEPGSVASEEEQAAVIDISLAENVLDVDQLQSRHSNGESSSHPSTDGCEDDNSDHTTTFVGGGETDAQAQPEDSACEVGPVPNRSLCSKEPDCSEGNSASEVGPFPHLYSKNDDGEEPTYSPALHHPTQRPQHHRHHQPRTQKNDSLHQLEIFTSVSSGAKTINTDMLSHECVVFTQKYEKSCLAFASSQEPIDDPGDDESSGNELDAFDRGLFYKVKSRRSDVSLIVARAFAHQSLATSWRELPDQIEESSWNLLWVWGMPKRADFDNLLSFQKINR